MNDTVLQVQGLCKNYPAFTLSEVSFSLEAGRIMGFIGRNGAGKTTTLKSILGLVHPDAGEIRYFGLPFAQNEQRIKEQGWTPFPARSCWKFSCGWRRRAWLSCFPPTSPPT